MRTSSRLPIRAAFFRLLLSVVAFAAIVHPVVAQTTSSIEVTSPDTSNYPDLSLRFRVMDSGGNFYKKPDGSLIPIIENRRLIISQLPLITLQRIALILVCYERALAANP
ncbi:hypothetical protein EG832_08920, partial [bacterium]|nr:hypothetical protein [bacterium]